jgi:rod shape-determining protein MreB
LWSEQADGPPGPILAWYCPLNLPELVPDPVPYPGTGIRTGQRDLVRGPFITHPPRWIPLPEPGRTAVVIQPADGALTLLDPARLVDTPASGPAVAYYEVDLTPQQSVHRLSLPSSRGGTFTASVELAWHVDDPVAFVGGDTGNVSERLLDHVIKEAGRVTGRHPVNRVPTRGALHNGLHSWPVPGLSVTCSVRLKPNEEPPFLPPATESFAAPPDAAAPFLVDVPHVLIGFDGPLVRLYTRAKEEQATQELAALLAELRHPDAALSGEPLSPGGAPVSPLEGRSNPLDLLRAFAEHPLGADLRRRLNRIEERAVPTATATPFSDSLITTLNALGRRVAVVADNAPSAVWKYLQAHGRLTGLVSGVHGRAEELTPSSGTPPGPPQEAPAPTPARCEGGPPPGEAPVRALGRPAMTVSLEQLRRCHFAVDLGAARTRVYVKGAGLVVDQPSAAAVNTRTGALIAVGEFAEKMTGRTPDYIRVVRPVSGGTVVDIEMAQRMLRHLIGDKVRRALRRKPRLRAAACTPHDADPLAQRAAIETLVGLGARRVELVDTLIAAAVGCGLPVERPEATMIMVCGAAATQVAVLSLGSIVTAERIPVGGEAVDHAIVQHLRHEHELMLPSQSVRPLQLALSGNGLTPHGPPPPRSTAGRGHRPRPFRAGRHRGRTGRDRDPADRRARRDRQGAAQLPARPGGRPRRPRDHDGRRQRAAPRPRPDAARGDRHAGAHRRAARRVRRTGPGRMLEGKIEPLVLDPLATT